MIKLLIYSSLPEHPITTRRPNTPLYMQFACYRKQKIKNLFYFPQQTKRLAARPPPHRHNVTLPAPLHPYTIGIAYDTPIPPHTDTSQQLPTPTTKHSLKKARGVCRGAMALWPLCGFPLFHKPPKKCLFTHISLKSLHKN